MNGKTREGQKLNKKQKEGKEQKKNAMPLEVDWNRFSQTGYFYGFNAIKRASTT